MMTEEYRDNLKENRMRTLATVWYNIVSQPALRHVALFTFNESLATKVVRHYVKDLEHLKERYGISERVQSPKVAGLMANAILKYRPIVPIDGVQKDIEHNEVNEYLAVYHGISICASFAPNGDDGMRALMSKPFFSEWLKRFIFLLRERNYTSESLIMIFETLCFAAFPDTLVDEKTVHI